METWWGVSITTPPASYNAGGRGSITVPRSVLMTLTPPITTREGAEDTDLDSQAGGTVPSPNQSRRCGGPSTPPQTPRKTGRRGRHTQATEWGYQSPHNQQKDKEGAGTADPNARWGTSPHNTTTTSCDGGGLRTPTTNPTKQGDWAARTDKLCGGARHPTASSALLP